MDKTKLEQVRYRSKFEIVKDSIERINPEFSYCTVLVAYHGDNRNSSSISKETFEKCLWSIYGIPIVGEWVRREDDPGKNTWGSHGGRIIVDDQGIRYEETTRPFGFVTEEAYRNAKWVEVLEKDGHTKHEYLKLDRCILWNSRYEECNSILDENFGQSMEIQVKQGHWREETDYSHYVIEDFTFSALCILGTAEPCFESAMIGRQYELSQFKKEFRLMLDGLKKFNLDTAAGADNAGDEAGETQGGDAAEGNASDENASPVQEGQDNSLEKEEADLEILFSEVCAKIKEQIGKHVYRYRTGKQHDKYVVLSISEADRTVTLIDREAGYAAYRIPYVSTQTKKGGLIVNIDFENKAAMHIGAVECTEPAFNVNHEVQSFAKEASEYDVNIHNTAEMNKLTNRIAELTEQFEAAQAKVAELEGHLAVFEREKALYMEQKHKDIIDALVASRREEMGNYSQFLEYCVDMDAKYAKTVGEVEGELKEIHYEFMLASKPGGKKNFSAIEVSVASGSGMNGEGSVIAERYGADIAKFFKN